MISDEKLFSMQGITVNEDNVDDYIDDFDIIKEYDSYLIPEYNVTYQRNAECHGFKIIDFDELIVNKGDLLVLMLNKVLPGHEDIIQVWDIDTDTYGYIKGYYFSDDGRYYLCNSVAKHFKNKKVQVANYLIYTKEETANYINAMYNL